LIAPWYAPYYYAPVSPWRYPWVYDPLYYDTYYPRWEIDLPTSDMLERALPEGVIEPGGRVTGFVYFPTIANDLDHVTFEASLSDGPDGERFAMLAVPFNVS
jgi:hypothetical protein